MSLPVFQSVTGFLELSFTASVRSSPNSNVNGELVERLFCNSVLPISVLKLLVALSWVKDETVRS